MQLVIVLSLASLLISTSFASTPFADEAWQESAFALWTRKYQKVWSI